MSSSGLGSEYSPSETELRRVPGLKECPSEKLSERRIVAEFFLNARGKYELFSLWVWDKGDRGCSVYDVDLSKIHGYCYHMSGGGFQVAEVSGPYWTNAPELVKASPSRLCDRKSRKRNKTRRLLQVPRHLTRSLQPAADLLEWLHMNAIESDTEWCSICRDRVPTMDTDHPCEHIWWCEKYALWSTPDERMDDCDDQECECAER